MAGVSEHAQEVSGASVSERPPRRSWTLSLPRGRTLKLDHRPRVMGVLNLTPDSFSDGGEWTHPERAVEHALAMLEAGADLLDLGAESTRPGGGVYGEGASEVSAAEEMQRLLPVLEAVREAAPDAVLSVDTRKGEVAAAALAAGADLVNDVSALGDEALGRVVAEAGCPLILMHSRGELGSMQRDVRYDDLLGEVAAELDAARRRARELGIADEQLLVDPGIGFGKNSDHNLGLIRGLDRLGALGRPVVLGASRKAFIGHLTGAPANERVPGSLAAVAWAAALEIAMVRVHDVAATVQFLAVWNAIREGTQA